MSDSVKRGRIIVIGICVYTAIVTLINNIIDFNLINVVLYVYIIFGLYYGHPKSRYIGAALYALAVVVGLYYIFQLARYGAAIPYMVYYLVIVVISAVLVFLLIFNKDVEEYLYYQEVG